MMTTQFTCKNCESGIHVYPDVSATKIKCDICQHEDDVQFDHSHVDGVLKSCPRCGREDFYAQKDFNRKLGVLLFGTAALISTIMLWRGMGPQWYLSTFIVLYIVDFFLFKKLHRIAICYKCNTIFRGVENIDQILDFDHEMNDRIVYSDQNFHGKSLDH